MMMMMMQGFLCGTDVVTSLNPMKYANFSCSCNVEQRKILSLK